MIEKELFLLEKFVVNDCAWIVYPVNESKPLCLEA
jgi:hypothetical protein